MLKKYFVLATTTRLVEGGSIVIKHRYIVQYKHHERTYRDIQVAIQEAEEVGESGVNAYVYNEVEGVRDGKPFYSFTWDM